MRVVQRSQPDALPVGISFVGCDVLDRASLQRALQGASNVLLAIGFLYDSRIWRTAWPAAMHNVVEACSEIGARVVFIDNLYQLGPQSEPRREDMPLTTGGGKPGVLAEVTRIWMAAIPRLRMTALRCPDFYGPGVVISHLGASAFGEMGKGKSAQMIAPPDTPHDFAYVPDIARAAVTLLDAPDSAYGQVWNMPCAPTRTPREILQIGADAIGARLKVSAIPLWILPFAGLFMRFMKEVDDVKFTWDRPYEVDATKFEQRFWSDVTPFEVGAAETARSFAHPAPSPATA